MAHWSRRLSPVSIVLSGWESLTPPPFLDETLIRGRLAPSKIWYSIYRPRKDGKLSQLWLEEGHTKSSPGLQILNHQIVWFSEKYQKRSRQVRNKISTIVPCDQLSRIEPSTYLLLRNRMLNARNTKASTIPRLLTKHVMIYSHSGTWRNSLRLIVTSRGTLPSKIWIKCTYIAFKGA